MPVIVGGELLELFGERYYGDGPPFWKVGNGRSWERWCDSAEEADAQRRAVVTKLKCHRKQGKNFRLSGLIGRLSRCYPDAPCESGACPVCERALQRWFVEHGHTTGRTIAMRGGRPRILSIVPDFGRVPRDALRRFDFAQFRRRTAFALRQADVEWFQGAMDVSFNHDIGDRPNGYFQFQWWLLVAEATKASREVLRAQLNRSGEVKRPDYQFKPTWPRSALGYGLKRKFDRRETFWDERVSARGRAPCWNTRDRDLLGPEWVELNLCLNRIGLGSRVLINAPT